MIEDRSPFLTASRKLLVVWIWIGLLPMLLQARTYLKLVTPHKISEDSVVLAAATKHAVDLEVMCPMIGLEIAHIWWNVGVTHYYEQKQGRVCHIVVPQYNIHGAYMYVLGNELVPSSSTTRASCADNSYYLDYFFYHGSIGYYAFYEEAGGTYCAKDNVGYVLVRGAGTYDSNGASLADDTGDIMYRRSYWYGLFGSIWILYRLTVLRRSFFSCKCYGQRCDNLNESILLKNAAVYTQESMRLSPHGAKNYHRAVLLFLLIESLMGNLFMLIAQDGLLAKAQYFSLGYNFSGVLSVVFEMMETMDWMGETMRCLLKRLFLNYETALVREIVCSAAMYAYLKSLNRSSLKETTPIAEAASFYVWSLVGHAIIVLGVLVVITSIRSVGALISVRWMYGSFSLLLSPCDIDTTLCKMTLLSGYTWQDGKFCYLADTLKS